MVSFSFFLCRSCAVSPQFFFRRSCSFCRYRFDVFIGGGEFRIFLCCHLGLEFWLNVTVDSLKISPPSLLAFSFCGFQYFTVKLPIYSLLCIYAVWDSLNFLNCDLTLSSVLEHSQLSSIQIMLLPHFFLSSCSGTLVVCKLYLFIMFYLALILYTVFSILFISVCFTLDIFYPVF